MNYHTLLKMQTILKTTIFAAVAAMFLVATVAPSMIGDASASVWKKKNKDKCCPSNSIDVKQKAKIHIDKVKQKNEGATESDMNKGTTESANNNNAAILQQSVAANVSGSHNDVQINTTQCNATQQTGDDIEDENIDDKACANNKNKNDSEQRHDG